MAETTATAPTSTASTAAYLGRQEEGAMLGLSRTSRYVAHAVLILGILVVAFPIYYTFVASTHTLQTILRPPLPLLPGDQFWENYSTALFGGIGRIGGVNVWTLLFNTTLIALAIAIGKIVISILSAYAIVFFRFPFRMTFFWLIFITLMLPVEVRIMPTYKVMVDLGLIDTYTGLTLPLMASATATLLFRQFFLTIPGELVEAARIDGAGPWRFFKDISAPAVEDQHRGALRHPLHLRLDAVSLAAADDQQQRHEHHRDRAPEDDLLRRRRHRMAPRHGHLACWRSCRPSWWWC